MTNFFYKNEWKIRKALEHFYGVYATDKQVPYSIAAKKAGVKPLEVYFFIADEGYVFTPKDRDDAIKNLRKLRKQG